MPDVKTILTQPINRPKLSLTIYFIAWKSILLLVALTSPGSGYDTSTTLISESSDATGGSSSPLEAFVGKLSTKLVRWDAIYFTQIAQRGYLFEQEWAFGWGFTRLLAFVGRGISYAGLVGSTWPEAVAGIAIAHICHLLSVFMLYNLSKMVLQPSLDGKAAKMSFISACLHIISPAGMFLSAPYAESPFCLLQFSGYYFYAMSGQAHIRDAPGFRDLYVITAGCLLGLATTLRSNGLMGGLIFAYDAVQNTMTLFCKDKSIASLQKLLVTALAGSLVGLGAVAPQYLAYQEFCTSRQIGESRAWCSSLVPSIYAWVQSHYWSVPKVRGSEIMLIINRNAGFLRYWTVSNIPLFILAGPMLLLMARSTLWAWVELPKPVEINSDDKKTISRFSRNTPREFNKATTHALVRRFSLPQAALAVSALAVYHVQIITRLSSAYPVWYWWLAFTMVENHKRDAISKGFNLPMITIRWIVMYVMIQGVLFASFLPPA
ncbi:MAG: hypothetical protein Q9187_001556 [Circinaria calcarea]